MNIEAAEPVVPKGIALSKNQQIGSVRCSKGSILQWVISSGKISSAFCDRQSSLEVVLL